jgi:hypothetical protein
MTIPFSAKVRVPEDVLVSELDGESVLLKLQSESYFGLDHIGTRIWELLLSSDSVQAAYEALLQEFEVDADRLRRDMTELLDSLSQQGLLEIASV